MDKDPRQTGRYFKPKNTKEAMEVIQDLFNQYRAAPLTPTLLSYHNNLTARLKTDIMRAAVAEQNAKRLKQLGEMVVAMETWAKLRASGQPFAGKMKNFKLTNPNKQKFKVKNHKIGGNHNYRGVTH